MPIYIVFINISTEGRKAIIKDPERIKSNNRELEAMGVKILGQYATLGQYDFINIFEVPDEDTIYKASVHLSGKGIHHVYTLAAKTIDDFIASMKK